MDKAVHFTELSSAAGHNGEVSEIVCKIYILRPIAQQHTIIKIKS